MKILYLNQINSQLPPCVVTVGFFDGVHRGHQFLIGQMCRYAREQGLLSAVVTFDRHPREVLGSNYQPQLLSTASEKMELLSRTGIDLCVVLPFSREMAALTAREFMEQVLRDKIHAVRLYIGYDNRFGHGRTEGFADYVAYGRELGIEVVRNEAFVLNGVNVSSSVVRSFVEAGEVELAACCLGYNYTVSGTVVGGVQEGRKMGFPTANIVPVDAHKLIPASGVYAVTACLQGSDEQHQGMMNIGNRPTFGGQEQTLETHILHFAEDIYGTQLSVSFVSRIREERRFESVGALRRQLEADERAVEQLFEEVSDGNDASGK